MSKTKAEYNYSFKKVPVVLIVLFSVFTLGIYTAYWFVSRKTAIQNLKGPQIIPFKWWWVFTVILVLSFLNRFIGEIFLSPYGIAIFDSIDTILSFYFLGLLYYSVFRLKELIEEEFEEKIFSSWLLLFFHVWYLQYKINRLGDMNLEEKTLTPHFAK